MGIKVLTKISYTAKIILTAVILYILIRSINPQQLFTLFAQANFWLISAAVIMGILNILMQFYKWRLICSNTLNEADNKIILHSLFIGFAGALITPFRLGEYAGRSYGLKNKDITSTTIATIIDHFFSIITIILMGLAAVLIFLKLFNHISLELFIVLLTTEFLLVLGVKWFINNASMFKEKLISYLSNIKYLKALVTKTDAIYGIDLRTRFNLLTFSILSFLFYTFQYSLLVSALSNQSALHLYMLVGILTIFTKTIIPAVTLGDLGIREGASVFFISQFGLPAEIGFNAALLLFCMNIAVPSVLGGILLLKR